MILAGAVLLASFLAPHCRESPPVPAALPPQAFLRLDHAIPLPGVKGRIDHLALDPKRDRLYIAALGNDSLEVVDLREKKGLKSLSDLSQPQGVLYLEALDVLVVSCGGSGKLDVFEGETHKQLQSLSIGKDADNLRYDAGDKHVFVAYGRGAVGILDPLTWKTLGEMKVAAHPEAFEVDVHSRRVFVNVPSERAIAIVDRVTHSTLAVWPVESAQANYPMALIAREAFSAGGALLPEGTPSAGGTLLAQDERLLVGCRNPAKLLVYDTHSGQEAAALDLSGDVDDIFWDVERQRAYASCGEGFIDVFERKSGGVLAPAGKVATRRGARTSLFVPQKKRLYLAVPEQDGNPAEVRVFEAVP